MLSLKEQSCHKDKSANERVTVLSCVNSDDSNKWVLILVGKFLKPLCSKNTKVPVKYYANEKAWMTITCNGTGCLHRC
jgi:hypothetical protein